MAVLHADFNFVLTKKDDIKKAVNELDRWGCCPRCILRFLGEKEQRAFRRPIASLAEWVQAWDRDTEGTEAESENGDKEALSVSEKPCGDTSNAGLPLTSDIIPEKSSNGADLPNEKNDEIASNANGDADGKTSEPEPMDTDNAKNDVRVCVACLGMLQEHLCSDEFLNEIKSVVEKGGHEYHNYFCSVSTPVNNCLREHAIWLSLKKLFPKDFIGSNTDDDSASIKEVWKWINGRRLAIKLGTHFSIKSMFTVSLNFTHENADNECAFLYNLYPSIFKNRKTHKKWEVFTRTNVLKAIGDTNDARFEKNFVCPPRILTTPLVCNPITSFHEPVFLAGRYNKYSRAMSQTPWLLDTGRKTNNSVEEVICLNANRYMLAKEYRFAASGREDVDVRMMGRGRPFVVEFIDPRKETFSKKLMQTLQEEINATTPDVKVRDLQIVTREDTQILKTGESEKVKKYSATCYARRDLKEEDFEKMNSIKELVLNQKTPVRVLHRRPLATRERTVHCAKAEPIEGNTNHFKMTLSTQAGTYVKEFVHGDFGRTSPNLGELLDTECDILELDVEEVLLDWPPVIEYAD